MSFTFPYLPVTSSILLEVKGRLLLSVLSYAFLLALFPCQASVATEALAAACGTPLRVLVSGAGFEAAGGETMPAAARVEMPLPPLTAAAEFLPGFLNRRMGFIWRRCLRPLIGFFADASGEDAGVAAAAAEIFFFFFGVESLVAFFFLGG